MLLLGWRVAGERGEGADASDRIIPGLQKSTADGRDLGECTTRMENRRRRAAPWWSVDREYRIAAARGRSRPRRASVRRRSTASRSAAATYGSASGRPRVAQRGERAAGPAQQGVARA